MRLPNIHREAWILLGVSLAGSLFLIFFLVWPFEPLTSLAYAAAIIRGALLTLTGLAVFVVPLSYGKRAGLAGATVGMVMSTQSLLIPHTPWEGWASIVASGGWLIYALCEFGPIVWGAIASSDTWFGRLIERARK